jgi:hypothetical protein
MSEPDDELEATAEERAEAEALARALERGGAKDAGPADAVAASAMLRAAARPAPDAAALEVAAARGRAALAGRRPRRRRWLLPVLAPTLAAAAVVLVARLTLQGPPHRLPEPSTALLEAQARAARGRADLTALDAQMGEYRAAYYAALAEEHP